MAVLDDCPGLKVEISVDARPLREYDNDDDEEAEPKAITKYVEVQSGADFVISSAFSAPFPTEHGVQLSLSVDGSRERVYNLKADQLRHRYEFAGIVYKEGEQWMQKNYRFTELSIVEEANGALNIPDLQRKMSMKGCITLKYRYLTNMRPQTDPPKQGMSIDLQDGFKALGAIPEKALKGDARSHQATLGAPYACGPRERPMAGDLVDKEPFATFRFKYRSLSALRALRIVLAEGADVATRAEPREAMRRQEVEACAIKREGTAHGQVKREHHTEALGDEEVIFVEARRRKRPRGDLEVIVLD